MSEPDRDGEYDTALDSLSCVYTTPNAARDKAVTLNLFTTPHSVNRTLITILVNILTHANKRLREISITYVTSMNYKEYSVYSIIQVILFPGSSSARLKWC